MAIAARVNADFGRNLFSSVPSTMPISVNLCTYGLAVVLMSPASTNFKVTSSPRVADPSSCSARTNQMATCSRVATLLKLDFIAVISALVITPAVRQIESSGIAHVLAVGSRSVKNVLCKVFAAFKSLLSLEQRREMKTRASRLVSWFSGLKVPSEYPFT